MRLRLTCDVMLPPISTDDMSRPRIEVLSKQVNNWVLSRIDDDKNWAEQFVNECTNMKLEALDY